MKISERTKMELLAGLIFCLTLIWMSQAMSNDYNEKKLEELKIEKQELEIRNEELFQIIYEETTDSVRAEQIPVQTGGDDVPDTVSGIESQIREISAYNLVESQCDSSPTIGAFGDDLLEMINQGINVCASNAFPENTRLHIQNYGECIVKDKMASRYKENIDLCFGMDIQRAKNFGRQKLSVKVLDN